MPRVALLLAYDGTDFAGWWRQPGLRTVAGELDRACAGLGETTATIGASRTDAGVHARGQVAMLDLARDGDLARFADALARRLPPDLALRGVARVAPDWHAVHDVRDKTYSYAIALRPDPFATRFAWTPPWPLDLAALNAAAELVPGERDWSAFVRRGEWRSATRCRVLRCTWRLRRGPSAPRLVCTITATAFIYRLARSLVGGMTATARGTATMQAWHAALHGDANHVARQMAPATGLCLERIAYRRPLTWEWTR